MGFAVVYLSTKGNTLKTPLNKTFPFNVWGLSLLIGSICFLFILISALVVVEPGELFGYLLGLIFFTAVITWPIFFICYLTTKYLSRNGVSTKKIRIGIYFLARTGVLLIALFSEPDIFEEADLLIGLICYIAGLTISFFTMKIEPTN